MPLSTAEDKPGDAGMDNPPESDELIERKKLAREIAEQSERLRNDIDALMPDWWADQAEIPKRWCHEAASRLAALQQRVEELEREQAEWKAMNDGWFARWKVAALEAAAAHMPVPPKVDDLTRNELHGRAVRALREAGWVASDKLSLHSVIETMIAFGITVMQDTPVSCGWPDCGCDADAVCNAALLAPPKAEG
jgi:hypothetical protein